MTTADLSTMTPVEIDTLLAEIHTRYYDVRDQVARKTKHLVDMEEGLAKAAEFAGTAKALRYSCYTQDALDRLLGELDALEAKASDVMADSFPYQAEYNLRPWSRFFLVRNNGGHIHSSMRCSTCFVTTRFGWLPEFSGQTEAEAVAKHGAILCTVCYPSAPTEWTNGAKPGDEDVCAGSGHYYSNDLPKRTGFYSGNWAECMVCHTNQSISKPGRIRKHKTPTD